MKVRYI